MDKYELLRERVKTASELFPMKIKEINKYTKRPYLIGKWREVIIKDFIRKNIPSCFTVSSGIIYNGISNNCPQVDILIYEPKERPVIKEFDEFVIVHPESVVCCIEIKSKLDKTGFYKAIEDSIKIRELRNRCRLACKYFLLTFGRYKLETIIRLFRDYPVIGAYSLDVIHCFDEKRNYSLVYSGVREIGNGGLHHPPSRYPYFNKLVNSNDATSFDKSFYSFIFLLGAYLNAMQGHYDDEYEKYLFLPKSENDINPYLKYLKDEVRSKRDNEDDDVILGGNRIKEEK